MSNCAAQVSTENLSGDQLVAQLQWRYATKRFDPHRKIPAPLWENLEDALQLAPSSFGLQPWRFVVITDPALRAKLKLLSWNQPQIEEASHLVVFMARRTITSKDIEKHLARIVAVRGVSLESLKEYGGMMQSFIAAPAPQFDAAAWAARQVYIALGLFLTATATIGVDACPMEGIDTAGYDNLLGDDAREYRTVVVAAAGYRASGDAYASAPKVRFPKNEVIVHR